MVKKLPLPKVRIFRLRRAIVILALAVSLFSSGYVLGQRGYKTQVATGGQVTISRDTPKENVDFSLFWKVWDTLSASYFDKSKLDPGKMVYGAISGMVSAVGDPYTVFLPPSENKVIEEDLNGSFEGVGIQIGFKGTQLAVVSALPGSPAEKAGVKAGDFIVEIKDAQKNIDKGTVGISLAEAVKDIRGPAGSKVTLALLRDSNPQPIIVDITREKLDVPSVSLSYIGENKDIADIKLAKFGGETEDEWRKAVGEIKAKPGVKGVVLDLRSNPGGYLQSSVYIANEFVKTGSTVVIEERGDGKRTEYKADRAGNLTTVPLVVIINGGSASASEILAGALRDLKGTKLVGEKSFGKGTIQEPEDLPGGAGLHVTIAKWLTPKGTWVNETGLEPDVKIVDNDKTLEDEQLMGALGALGVK